MIYEMISGINPFKLKNKSKYEKLQLISQGKIPYFPIFSDDAKDLLQQLLVSDPNKRLGYGKNGIQDIKSHRFFKGIEWDDILSKKIGKVPEFNPLQ
jgi:protein kinase X